MCKGLAKFYWLFASLFTGGTCISWETNSIPLSELLNSPNDYLIIKDPNQQESLSFNNLLKGITNKGKRAIHVNEIARAIIIGSCEKECNANFNKAETVFIRSTASLPSHTQALAENTETEMLGAVTLRRNEFIDMVPDSLEISSVQEIPARNDQIVETTAPTTSKRKIKEEIHTEMEKKLKVENSFAAWSR